MTQGEDFLRRRRDRAMATILGAAERNLAAPQFRKVVLDVINDFYNCAIDVLESVDDGTMLINDLYLQKLDAIYETVVSSG